MLLPTKGIGRDRALLTIGSRIVALLDRPLSVTAVWDRFGASQPESRFSELITFDWFVLALSALHALDLIDWTPDGRLRRSGVSTPSSSE